MIRITAYGLLVGWGEVALWIFLPMAGTILGLFIWYLIRYLVELRLPEIAKVRAAREEAKQVILSLKARMYDVMSERDRVQKAEAKLREFAEEVRSSNRNLNSRATEALK